MPILRAVQIAACMVLLALPVFARLLESHRSRYRRLVQASLLLILVSGALWFIWTLAEMSGSSLWEAVQPDLLLRSLQTQFGRLWAGRMAGALLLLLGLWRVRPLAIAAAAGLLGSLAWASHAAAGAEGSVTLHLGADLLHLLLGAIWPAGLVPFHLWLRDLRPDERTLAAAAPIARGFSRLSTFIVAGLLLSGAVNMWLMLGGILPLYTTVYGRFLLIKLSLLNVMLVLGAQNLRRWIPNLALIDVPGDEPHPFEMLRRNVLAELCLGAALLLVVGGMSAVPPPAQHVHPAAAGNVRPSLKSAGAPESDFHRKIGVCISERAVMFPTPL